MTLCHFLGAKLMHFDSKTIVIVHILLFFIFLSYSFVSIILVFLSDCKQNAQNTYNLLLFAKTKMIMLSISLIFIQNVLPLHP
ncbi:hypothetical protein SAMN05216463_11053 [Xylanibacter ruminicola]|uniref:Uncharacterized protein n=1 Tax=Xylanibacter ruminicola TaxID=839 RepID=A0A1M6UQ23_XYLRU|nr:hypothetical protein SAMN05216463_11053 [Xylanibacter ruminicola]